MVVSARVSSTNISASVVQVHQSNLNYMGSAPSVYDYALSVGTAGSAYVGIGRYNGQPAIQGIGTGTAYRLLLNPSVGNVGVSNTNPLAKLDVKGTISASDAVQVGTSSLTCGAGIPGAIRYNAGFLQLCNGSSWNTLAGGGATDRITAGTVSVTANSNGFISLTTGVTDWGYLSSGNSFLPRLVANQVSSSNISATHLQLSSPTTVLACNTGLTGSMRYTSGTMQVCNGSSWGNIGLGVPTGTIAAFAASSCPSGWTEYTASRGRFLRGIDNGAGIDPSGTRVGGDLQDDAMQRITGEIGRLMRANDSNTGAFSEVNTANNNIGGGTSRPHALISFDSANSPGARTSTESRPSNVAVTFCMYAGFQSAPGETVITQLSSMTDVSVGGAQSGQLLSYNGSSWVPINPLAGDRITSGTSSLIASQNQSITLSTGGVERIVVGSNGFVGLGLVAPKSNLHVNGSSWTVLTVEAATNDPALQLTSDGSVNTNDWTIRMDVSDADRLQWRYDNIARVTLDVSGSMGIGTTAPKAKLDVVGTISASDAIQVGTSSLTCSNGIPGALRYNGGSIQFCNGTNWTTLSASGGDNLGNHVATQNIAMQSYNIVGTGQVSVTNVSATTLQVAGNITYYGVLTDASDRRFKTDISPMMTSLEQLLALKPVSFVMKGDSRTELGFIAQDVEKVFPSLVFTQGPNGIKSLNYTGLISPIVRAIQELSDKADGLSVAQARHSSEVKELRAANDNLRMELKTVNDNVQWLRSTVDELRLEIKTLKQSSYK